MGKDFLTALHDWVRAEIGHALAEREEGPDGQRESHHALDQAVAKAWQEVQLGFHQFREEVDP